MFLHLFLLIGLFSQAFTQTTRCRNYWTADNEFRLFQSGAQKLTGNNWSVSYLGSTVNANDRIVIYGRNYGTWTASNPAGIAGGFNVPGGLKTNTVEWKCSPRRFPLQTYQSTSYNFDADTSFTTPIDLGSTLTAAPWAGTLTNPVKSMNARWIWCGKKYTECICVARKNRIGTWGSWSACVGGISRRFRRNQTYCGRTLQVQSQARRCCRSFWTTDNAFKLYQNGGLRLSGTNYPTSYFGASVSDTGRIVIIGRNSGAWSASNPAAMAGGFDWPGGLVTNSAFWKCIPATRPDSFYINQSGVTWPNARQMAVSGTSSTTGPNIWSTLLTNPIKAMGSSRGARWIWCTTNVNACVCISQTCTNWSRWTTCRSGVSRRYRSCRRNNCSKPLAQTQTRKCCPNFWTADNSFRLYQFGSLRLSGASYPTSFSGLNVDGFGSTRIVIIGRNSGTWSGSNPAAIAGGFNVPGGLVTNSAFWKCVPATRPDSFYINQSGISWPNARQLGVMGTSSTAGPNIWSGLLTNPIKLMGTTRGARWIWCQQNVNACVCISQQCTNWSRWSNCVGGVQRRFRSCRSSHCSPPRSQLSTRRCAIIAKDIAIKGKEQAQQQQDVYDYSMVWKMCGVGFVGVSLVYAFMRKRKNYESYEAITTI